VHLTDDTPPQPSRERDHLEQRQAKGPGSDTERCEARL
jgi:hypothetical protein